jgi:NAD-dependent dihydropyrimidine dehydrogenase PreA subunit
MKREIIKIDEEKCTGCGLCIPGCPEGALQMIDGKARLVSDLMCDGLGACIGDCPEGAIEIEEREAEPYDEIKVIQEIVKQGKNTVIAHLSHLQDHGEFGFLKQATNYLVSVKHELDFDLNEVLIKNDKMEEPKINVNPHHEHGHGCPGSAMRDFKVDEKQMNAAVTSSTDRQPSTLQQWPVQMHLVNPNAPYFRNADVVLAADCVAFSMGNFHRDYLDGKGLAIACPKLDQGMEVYVDKLRQMVDVAKINTLQVMIMEVPCCGGLIQMAKMAVESAERNIPIKKTVVSIRGEVLSEEWV